MNNQLKEWKDYPDLLDLLKSRGLIINDERRVLNYLERIGYYRLSGYLYSFRAVDQASSTKENRLVLFDFFKPETCFEDILGLYIFDKKLRLLAFDALERIEMALRNDIVHTLGKRDPCAYENPKCLHGNFTRTIVNDKNVESDHARWLKRYGKLLKRSEKKPFIAHHKRIYGGKLPIWVSAEIWDFGLLSHLFAGMQRKDQDEIAAKYGAKDGLQFEKWIKSLNFIRNVCAHHSRLWNSNILDTSPTPYEWQPMQNSRAFLYFCLIQKLLNVICPKSSWKMRFHQLLSEFPEPKNKAVSLSDFGIIENWQKLDIWQK